MAGTISRIVVEDRIAKKNAMKTKFRQWSSGNESLGNERLRYDL